MQSSWTHVLIFLIGESNCWVISKDALIIMILVFHTEHVWLFSVRYVWRPFTCLCHNLCMTERSDGKLGAFLLSRRISMCLYSDSIVNILGQHKKLSNKIADCWENLDIIAHRPPLLSEWWKYLNYTNKQWRLTYERGYPQSLRIIAIKGDSEPNFADETVPGVATGKDWADLQNTAGACKGNGCRNISIYMSSDKCCFGYYTEFTQRNNTIFFSFKIHLEGSAFWRWSSWV